VSLTKKKKEPKKKKEEPDGVNAQSRQRSSFPLRFRLRGDDPSRSRATPYLGKVLSVRLRDLSVRFVLSVRLRILGIMRNLD
jgi:hypothetical protein